MKEAKDFAESIAAIFMETSARNAVNVEELFQKISKCSMCSHLIWFVYHSLVPGLGSIWIEVSSFGK